MIVFTADIRSAKARSTDAITTSSVGIPVTLALANDFDGLAKTAVFVNGTASADVALVGDATSLTVPVDVLQATGQLHMGIYAADGEGNIVIPTVWAYCGTVLPGTVPSGVDPSAPTPSWVAQVQGIASDALETANAVQAQIDAGDFTDVVWVTYGTSTNAEIEAAYQTGKVVCTKHQNKNYILTYRPSNKYFYFLSAYLSGIYKTFYYATCENGTWNNGAFSIPSASSSTPKPLGTAAAGSTTSSFARPDHVHPMPSASDVGAAPSNRGIPSGGSSTQVLAKASDNDYDVEWVDQSGGGGGTSDYDDLTDKPQINGVTLSGNKSASDLSLGTYSKPSGGIPKTDLASAVQTSLGKADTALQSAPVTSVNGQTGAVTVSVPSASSATPQALGTAAAGSSGDFSRADHVHAKPTYSKSDVGLGNVDNVQQYSANNPPPYPVTSVNGSTGAVTLSIPSSASDVGAVAVAQGVAHAGEFVVVGSDGNITTVTMATWSAGSY